MSVMVRTADKQDFPAVLACADAAVPFDPAGNRRWLHYRQQFDEARYLRRHYVAVVAERVVGYGALEQQGDDPKRLRLYLVTVASRLPNVGQILWGHLLAEAQSLSIQQLWLREYDRDTDLLAFFTARGFVETSRLWEERLTLSQARLTPFLPRVEAIEAEGFVTRSLADLQQAQNADYLLKLHDLLAATRPGHLPLLTPEQTAQWLHRPERLPAAFFVIEDGNRYVGYSHLTVDDLVPQWLVQQETVIRPGYKGRGLTLPLRLHGILYAQHNDHRTIVAFTPDENFTVLALNGKLGFQRQFLYVNIERRL